MTLLDKVFETTQPSKIKNLEILTTQKAGRTLVAKVDLAPNSLVFTSSRPFARTVMDDRRREVCQFCFHIASEGWTISQPGKLGSNRPIRWFCSTECLQNWKIEYGLDGLLAAQELELLIRKAERLERFGWEDLDEISVSNEEVEEEWMKAEKLQKNNAKAAELLRSDDDLDNLRLLLDGIIGRYLSDNTSHDSRPSWDDMHALVPSLAFYENEISGLIALHSHIRMYNTLMAAIPANSSLRQYVTPHTILSILARDSCNSFGVWGLNKNLNCNELLGYAVYPQISLFNHSCAPNVHKERTQNVFNLIAGKQGIKRGEEALISYLGSEVDVAALSPTDRKKKLKNGWQFDCCCSLCQENAA